MPGTQVLDKCGLPTSPLLPGWGNQGRKVGAQAKAVLSGAPSSLWCRSLSADSPSHLIKSTAPYLPLGEPQLLPLTKTPFGIQKLFRRAWHESRGRASFSKQAFRDERAAQALISKGQWPVAIFPTETIRWCPEVRKTHSKRLDNTDWTTISPPPNHSPRQTSQESNSFISCVMGFYLKSTFNTGIVSQIQVFTLYSTKVFEYYSLYKMGPYKNTDNLMFLYSLL